jgi:translation initiation factor 1A
MRPKGNTEENTEVLRVRLPRGTEVLGIVERRLGAARMRVRCMDKKIRLCRIPGAQRRYLWVRESNIVLVKPWELEGDEKGDVIFKYSRSHVDWLRMHNKLSALENMEEF